MLKRVEFRDFQPFQENVGKYVHFINIRGLCENSDFAVKASPETAPGLTFNKGFPPRREGDYVFVENIKFMRQPLF